LYLDLLSLPHFSTKNLSLKKIMLLQKKENGTLVEILDIQEVMSPSHAEVMIRVQSGQEEQDPEPIEKQDLIFPSGESLPRCWIDSDYQKEKST
jgi:hypothetical protein